MCQFSVSALRSFMLGLTSQGGRKVERKRVTVLDRAAKFSRRQGVAEEVPQRALLCPSYPRAGVPLVLCIVCPV